MNMDSVHLKECICVSFKIPTFPVSYAKFLYFLLVVFLLLGGYLIPNISYLC